MRRIDGLAPERIGHTEQTHQEKSLRLVYQYNFHQLNSMLRKRNNEIDLGIYISLKGGT